MFNQNKFMNNYSLSNVRKMWLDFLQKNNHLIVESKSLIPQNDNSLLWINSGVATLKKYFSGQENPPSKMLANSQRCIRTNDIWNVGVTSRHHTFFEMLGCFSIGGYFRDKAIELMFEFLTSIIKLDVNKLYITVFENDNESLKKWIELGIDSEKIIKCDKTRNFWEIGQGPCGPCTEVYYDRGEKFDPNNVGEKLFFDDIENDRYIEILNIVFSEFENDGNNNYKDLIRKNIDIGAGLERIACILQSVNTNYDIDAFEIPRNEIEKSSNFKYDKNLYFEKNKSLKQILINKSYSVIIDHLKSSIFTIADGVIPSNKDRGYIIRKLLRISFIYFDVLGIEIDKNRLTNIIDVIISTMSDYYPYLITNRELICSTILKEYNSHKLSLSKSLEQFIKLINDNKLDEKSLFHLVDTYGFPIEIIKELEINKNIESINFILKQISLRFNKEFNEISNININFDLFNKYFDDHREISKSSSNINTSMIKQNKNLIELDVVSNFDYDIFECDSKVLKIYDESFNELNEIQNDSGFLVLDKTCFYATSGGQMHDIGYINNYFIDNVIKSVNGQNLHHFTNGSFKILEIVNCKINVENRRILTCHHSTEHLIHSSLKRKINNSIKQEGALKTNEKVTFDFHYQTKLTIDEIKEIENDIKNKINQSVDTQLFNLTLEEAQEMGALSYFENVYKKIKSKLRVIKITDDSLEICGGTHIKNTKEIENFLITKLESKGNNNWRIEAISTNKLIDKFNSTIRKNIIDEIKNYILEVKKIDANNSNFLEYEKIDFNLIHPIELRNLSEKIRNEFKIIKHKFERNNQDNLINKLKDDLKTYVNEVNTIFLENIDRKILLQSLTNLINENTSSIYIVCNLFENKYQYFLCCNLNLISNNDNILKKASIEINEKLNGKGGGRNNFIQGNINESNSDKVKKEIELIKEQISKWIKK